VVTPLCFPNIALAKFHALGKTVKYDGLKEEVYLAEYRPCNNPIEQLNISKDKIIVVVRPPATMALYHRFPNDLFYEAVQHILHDRDVAMVAFPRSKEQRKILESFSDTKLKIPEKAVDGRDMLHHADMVLSAGGTMNREAAVLGVPAYTVFKGRIGAADRSLIAMGRIVPIRSKDDFKRIVIQKAKQKRPLVNPNVRKTLINIILQH
jgi:predicted glycosyltransferase